MWERFSSWRTQTTAEGDSRLQDHQTQLLHLHLQVHLRSHFEIFMKCTFIHLADAVIQCLYTWTFNLFLLSVGMNPWARWAPRNHVFQSVRNTKTSMSHYLCLHDCIFIQTFTWIYLLVDKWIGFIFIFVRGKKLCTCPEKKTCGLYKLFLFNILI